MNVRRMNVRRAAAFLFAALCVGLSAFVLRGQIAAHPKPPAFRLPDFPEVAGGPTGAGGPIGADRPPGPKAWRVATGAERRAALATINDQLAAIRAGDGDRAWFYQSRGLRGNFASGQAFVAMIGTQYPEFGHAASASFGPVLTNPEGNLAGVPVTVRGQNGRLAPAYYMLVKEDGGYKVAGVSGGRAAR